MEKSDSSSSNRASREDPVNRVYYLAKSAVKGSAVLHAVRGHFRSPSSQDLVLGKETSLELAVVCDDGVLQPVCEQIVFGIIKDLDVLRLNEKFHGQKSQGKDLLVVLSDSGKLTFLNFCNDVDRFLPVTHVQLASPGNSRNQLGRMLAIDSNGRYVAVSAYENKFALLSISTSDCTDLIDMKIFYPPEDKGSLGSDILHGTIWSMCFISKGTCDLGNDECTPILAVIMHRRSFVLNELVLFGCYNRGDSPSLISRYSERGPLAVSISNVPHIPGFALLFRVGDVLLMNLSNPLKPCCTHRIDLNFLRAVEESLDESVDESLNGLDVDDEDISIDALLALRDAANDIAQGDDPMCVDSSGGDSELKQVCSWSWEPTKSISSKLIICLDTGELCLVDINSGPKGVEVNINDSAFKCLPCKALLWVHGGYVVAFAEMSDGMVLRLEDGGFQNRSTIQNIAPILDMSSIDSNYNKWDKIFACCGVGSGGSLRIIQSGVTVEKLLKTPPIYQGITGAWTLQMKKDDCYHSFLVLSFVEETRVLSVGLNFSDVSDAVGFHPHACTLACGLLADGMLVQIHRSEVRLCLPTSSAHPDGIPLSAPICTSWRPDNVSISLGAVGHNMVVIATANPCCLFIISIRSLSDMHKELYEVQRIELRSEVSCISVLCQNSRQVDSMYSADPDIKLVLPSGLEIDRPFVIGTHKPSVEIFSFVHGKGFEVRAVGNISLSNALGIPIIGCIPEDVRFVLVDRGYVLSGLRNGMLLRFEWPAVSLPTSSELPSEVSIFSSHHNKDTNSSNMLPPASNSHQYSSIDREDNTKPVHLQLIAIRRIGVTPVFLVPLCNSLDSDVIALTDRPWLIHAKKHSLSYTSISFQTATHVTSVCSIHCPKGVLFVAENSLHLVEMVQSERLNVQKLPTGYTFRKILHHNESETLFAIRTGFSDPCLSDICRIDPIRGSILSRYTFEFRETVKCMEIVKVGTEQVLMIGTSYTAHPIMPSGEAESGRGRLIIISLEHKRYPSATLCSSSSLSSEIIPTCWQHDATEQSSSSSLCSGPYYNTYGTKIEASDAGNMKLINSKFLPGAVTCIRQYSDKYFLASAGNILAIFGFLNDDPRVLRRYASTRTRFAITSLDTHSSRIIVGDCRDGIISFIYMENERRIIQHSADPMHRLVADCTLVHREIVFASSRMGSIFVLDSLSEDDSSPECNFRQSCAYYMGEITTAVRKSSISRKLRMEDEYTRCPNEFVSDASTNIVVAGTLLGSVVMFIPIEREIYELLNVIQSKLAIHPLTAPVLGNNHCEFRGRGSPAKVPVMLDGDMLTQFLVLTTSQQEELIASIGPQDTEMNTLISVDQVAHLLEQIHYAIN